MNHENLKDLVALTIGPDNAILYVPIEYLNEVAKAPHSWRKSNLPCFDPIQANHGVFSTASFWLDEVNLPRNEGETCSGYRQRIIAKMRQDKDTYATDEYNSWRTPVGGSGGAAPMQTSINGNVQIWW